MYSQFNSFITPSRFQMYLRNAWFQALIQGFTDQEPFGTLFYKKRSSRSPCITLKNTGSHNCVEPGVKQLPAPTLFEVCLVPSLAHKLSIYTFQFHSFICSITHPSAKREDNIVQSFSWKFPVDQMPSTFCWYKSITIMISIPSIWNRENVHHYDNISSSSRGCTSLRIISNSTECTTSPHY